MKLKSAKKKNKSCMLFSHESIDFTEPVAEGFRETISTELSYNECFLEKFHLHFGESNLKLHYVEKTRSFFSFNSNKSSFDELKHLSK